MFINWNTIEVKNKDEKANINQNVARLRIRQEKLNKYFLIVFLKSIYAQSQILGLNTGNAQSYLNTEKSEWN